MVEDSFDALLTFDKNLQHQQYFKKYKLVVFMLKTFSNTYKMLSPLSQKF